MIYTNKNMDTERYKNKLEEELNQVIKELRSLGIQNLEVDSDWIATPETGNAGNEPDLNDAADEAEDWAERRATLSVLETRFNNIKLALKKIEDGTYGICEISGEPIEEDRLAVNPAARTCKKHIDREPR